MAKYSGIFTTTQQMQAVAATTWTAGPGAPTSVTASAGNQSASVSFTAPTNTGNPPGISSYIVTSSPGGITASGSSSPITVSGLTNGTAYTFTVQAIGTYSGPGAISAASNSVTPSPPYIEDVFSTYLYTGNGSTQTITNGIDLSTKGGMVWNKSRNDIYYNYVNDTVRGAGYQIYTNATNAQFNNSANGLTSFTSSGFTLGYDSGQNYSGINYASWTFAKQAKFFDVVTYTGNGDTFQQIPHSLGSRPGFIAIKATSTTGSWWTTARRTDTQYAYGMRLNGTDAAAQLNWNPGTAINSTDFTTYITDTSSDTNTNGVTYVAYLFAHDAGGFGASGTDNVISCGNFTTDGSGNATINLGYEPQWVLYKAASTTGNWFITDNMRGFYASTTANILRPNTTGAEEAAVDAFPNATGFSVAPFVENATYIYIAIRRGPMKTPTTGTSVFSPVLGANTSTGALIYNTGFPVDMLMQGYQAGGANNAVTVDRLRGSPFLSTSLTDAEATPTYVRGFASNSGVVAVSGFNYTNIVGWNFRRAPGFFDEVCYTGTGSNTTKSHNLGVAPELMLIKKRSGASNWVVYAATLGAVPVLFLNNNSSKSNEATCLNSTAPTASVFSIGTASETNGSGSTYVAYLFATCTGVSKVGSYTGNGSSQTINCGFTGGARFVMIKRTNDTGDWYVWDTARGMVAGTDPFLRLNEPYSENNTNSVYTVTTGFQVVTTDAEMNASGSNYIYLAIA